MPLQVGMTTVLSIVALLRPVISFPIRAVVVLLPVPPGPIAPVRSPDTDQPEHGRDYWLHFDENEAMFGDASEAAFLHSTRNAHMAREECRPPADAYYYFRLHFYCTVHLLIVCYLCGRSIFIYCLRPRVGRAV